MSIIREHLPFYREIFKFEDFWKTPFLMIGLPDIEGNHIPGDFKFDNLKQLVKSRGIKEVFCWDLFDPKADIRLDLNKPVPEKYRERFKVVIDIGTLEHIFDTRQCLENYLRMVKTGGLFTLVTPINGYFGHGLHVFNPEGIKEALKINNFEILYCKYITSTGYEVENPATKRNILIWIVARKKRPLKIFKVPQQKYWETSYKQTVRPGRENSSRFAEAAFVFREGKRRLVNLIPKNIRNRIY
jgi:hypothetical protein